MAEAARPAPAGIHLNPLKLEEVQRRTQMILRNGPMPEVVFVCHQNEGLLGLPYAAGKPPALLLFSTWHGARDYARVLYPGANPVATSIEMLPQLAPLDGTAGFDTFTLNRCPRCNLMVLASIQILHSKAQLASLMAADQATRWVQGEILAHSVMASLSRGEVKQARTHLEDFRDHVDCGNPYVHQMLGVIAASEEDREAEKAVAERLKEFGAPFDSADGLSPETVATAMVALLASLGVPMQADEARPAVEDTPRRGWLFRLWNRLQRH